MTAPLIYGALADVMDDVGAVTKTGWNDHQKFKFRGVDAVVNAVSPALRKHKVMVLPEVEAVEYREVSTSTGKPATACRVVVAYRFTATDGSGLSAKVAAEAWDSGDKACPKAMSVAFRTALLQALALPTDEDDPDSQTYERAPSQEQHPQAYQQQPPAPPPPRTYSREQHQQQRGQQQRPTGNDPASEAQVRAINTMTSKLGITDRASVHLYAADVVRHDVESLNHLTKREASNVIEALNADLKQQPPPDQY